MLPLGRSTPAKQCTGAQLEKLHSRATLAWMWCCRPHCPDGMLGECPPARSCLSAWLTEGDARKLGMQCSMQGMTIPIGQCCISNCHSTCLYNTLGSEVVTTFVCIEVSCAETLVLNCCLISVHIHIVYFRAASGFFLSTGKRLAAQYACVVCTMPVMCTIWWNKTP